MPCSPKLKACVDDLIAQGKPESSAWAICRSQLGETYRHPDFEKIYRQFLTVEDGENRYYNWISALNLDETRNYANSMKEQFNWIKRHVDFNLWKEDSRSKYWKVEAGFPLTSMNENVYTEDELLRSARTIKGQIVNVNHKYSLPTVEILAGEYENGVVECVLRVPKSLQCPVCSENKTVNDLIESNGIVNVSLEASCAYAPSEFGKCEGMYFTGLSLLTKDTLPGIPLTRLMPLEHIMVEALQSSTGKRKMKKKIVMEILEDTIADERCPEGQIRNPETGKCEPVASDNSSEMQTVDITPMEPKPSMEPDENGQCEPGYMLNSIGKCVPTEECGEGKHWDANANDGQGGCVDDTPPKVEHPETAVGTPAASREDVLTDAPTEVPTPEEQPPVTGTTKIPAEIPAAGEQPAATGDSPEVAPSMKPNAPSDVKPASPHDCPDGYHYEPDATPPCVPNQPIVERVARIKAENRAKNAEEIAANWELHYVKLNEQHQKLSGANQEQSRTIRQLQQQSQDLNEKRVKLQGELNEEQRETGRLHSQIRSMQDQLDKLKNHSDELSKKYQNAVAINLELSRKNVKANEDYLEVATKNEYLEAQLKKAKDIGKKIYRIKT
jgi:hypothetical protein